MTTEQVLRQLLNAITENIIYGDPDCDCNICKAVILAQDHLPKFCYIGIDSGANWGRYTSIDDEGVFEMLDYFDTLPEREIWGIELDERIEGPREED